MASRAAHEGQGASPGRWLAALLGLGLLERGLLLWLYQPVEYGDTPTYYRLSRVLFEGGLAAYDATRVPGYPLFVGLLRRQDQWIMGAQVLLGVAISLLLFALVWRLTRRPEWAFAGGMLYNLAPAQVLFEANVLSETLTAFLVIASLALFPVLQDRVETRAALPLAFALGLVASAAGLVRTLFFFLPLLLLPFVTLSVERWRRRLALAAAFSLPPLLLLGGWIGFVYTHYGMLSPTTMGGYHMVQHTGEFFEYLPEGEALIRDTYLKYRAEQVAARGVQTNAIWDAIPELSQETGLSFFALSAKLQQLSLQLIMDHPGLYLRNVVEGWLNFWKAPVYWRADAAAPLLQPALAAWIWPGRLLALLANGLFLAGSGLLIVRPRLRRWLQPPRLVVLSGLLVLVASVVQTLVDHGDNPRFLVPLQMVVILCVLWAGWRTIELRRASNQIAKKHP